VKIAKIKIVNDRVLGNIDFDFTNEDNQIVNTIILAGENGVGKTRLLDIIYRFTNGTLRESINRTDEIYTFEIEFNENEIKELIEDKNFFINSENNISRNRFVFTINCKQQQNPCKIEYLDQSGNVSQSNSPFVLWSESRKYFLSVYSTTQVNFNVKSINSVTATEIDEKINSSLIQNENLATEIAQLLVDIDASDNSDLAEWVRGNMGKAPTKDVIERRMKRFKQAFEYMFPMKKMVKIQNMQGQKKVIFEENGNLMDIDKLSSGEKQIVFRGGFLLKDINSNRGVILIDEPEISLHPTWQMKIGGFFRKLFKDENGKDTNQIIMTTHSPFIIHNEYRKDDKVLILKKSDGGKITVDDSGKYYGWTDEKIIQQAFNIDNFVKKNPYSNSSTLIITEGKTDWKHMKKAYKKLLESGEIKEISINFLEYEDTLGDSRLYQLFEYMSMLNNQNKVIFIFDRDTRDIVKKVAGKDKDYKYNRNKVYSMAIPVPEHRKDTPEICIEHLYLDQDIKREKAGRRMYLGNEFSRKSGIHKENPNIFCVKKDKCGKESYKIIDSDCFVASIKDEDENIAMSKDDFANNIISEVDEFKNINFQGFKLLFEVISEIIELEDK